jgi:hypothetical protein
MHSVRVLLAELRRSRSSHDLFGDDTTTLRFFEQKKSMVGSAKLLLFACSCASSDSASLPLR